MAKLVPYHFKCMRCNWKIDSDDHKKLWAAVDKHTLPCIKSFLAKPENAQYKKNYPKEIRQIQAQDKVDARSIKLRGI